MLKLYTELQYPTMLGTGLKFVWYGGCMVVCKTPKAQNEQNKCIFKSSIYE